MHEDDVLLALSDFATPQPARIVAAHLFNRTERDVIDSGDSAEISKVLLRLVSRKLVFKDYPYGVQYVAYGLSPAGRVRAEHLRLARQLAA